LVGTIAVLGCGSSVTTFQSDTGTTGGGNGGGGNGGAAPATYCTEGAPLALTLDGVHFALVELTKPIQTQLQLLLEIEHVSGSLEAGGQLVNADRNSKLECEPPCGDGLICSSTKGCVLPTEKASSVDEYADFTANGEPPTGYGAAFLACVSDVAGGTFVSKPFDIEVASPPLSILDIVMVWEISSDPAGTVRGQGTFVSAELLLGSTPSGSAEGALTVRAIPVDALP